MTKVKSRFHYTDEKDMETTPEKAARITMLSFDQNQKICNRIDWIRDESNICKNCDNQTSFSEIRYPYACKLLMQELESMSITPRIIT